MCPLCAPDFHLRLLRTQDLQGQDWRLPPFVKMPKDQASSMMPTQPSPGLGTKGVLDIALYHDHSGHVKGMTRPN